MYDPKRFRMPKELAYSKHKVPFTLHPRSEMEKTFEEIFSFNKLRSEEEVNSASEFFKQHPRDMKHAKISIA